MAGALKNQPSTELASDQKIREREQMVVCWTIFTPISGSQIKRIGVLILLLALLAECAAESSGSGSAFEGKTGETHQ